MDTEHEPSVIEAVATGDHRALGVLYDQHASSMLALAIRLLGDRLEAEDLVHDVFVEAWSKAQAFAPERGSVRAWLLVRVRSRAIDRLRRAAVAQRHVQQEATEAPAARGRRFDDPAAAFDRARVSEAVGALSANQRTVLELAYFGGLSCSEIAAQCNTPLGTVKSRLASGLRELRNQFETSTQES